jgi:hypothetical protein
VQQAGDVSQLHTFLGRKAAFPDQAAAARALLDTYGRRLGKLKSLRKDDGTPRLDAATFDRASLSRWDIYLASSGPKAEYDLILSNGLLIEDSATLASFHTLATGTANGSAYPVANSCVVAYFPLLSDDPDVRADRLGRLAADERLSAIAYVVAHEVGTHLIKVQRDDYSRGAGLARPLFAIEDKADILSYRSWKLPMARPLPLNAMYFRCEIARTRLNIAASRGDQKAFDEAINALLDLPVERLWLERVAQVADEVFQRASKGKVRPGD